MAGRFKRQPSRTLEIRGSVIDHPRVEPVNEVLTVPALSHETFYYDSMRPSLDLNSDDDDDESTVVGEPIGRRSASPEGTSQCDETVTDSGSHYWSAGNSFTTGNTTERSSVYSWGDDEFDLQASRIVRQMFQAIEKMLFEGVLSGSTSLQYECREWMSAFPHLRILGKQILPCRDEGFQIVSSQGKKASSDIKAITSSDVLEVKGSYMAPHRIPSHLSFVDQDGGKTSGSPNEYSQLFEEVFAEDGHVEEYLAYDIREMDEEEHSKKYYVPRRRRLGFPPITPNACVRDAVLHHVFDAVWAQVVAVLSGPTKSKSTSLLKLLVENLSWAQEKNPQGLGPGNAGGPAILHDTEPRAAQMPQQSYYAYGYDEDDIMYNRPGITVTGHFHPGSSMLMPHLAGHPRLLYADHLALPPSRGSYLEQSGTGGRHMPFSSGRLSTAPYQNAGDINALNDVMKISQKKIQPRTIPHDDMSPGPLPDSRIPGRPSSSQFMNGPHLNGPITQLGSLNHHLSAIGITGTPSPLTTQNRPFTSRDILPRQQSATTRKGRAVGRLARLMPLDRAKTPNVDFNGLNVKATRLVPGHLETPSYGSQRINSPPNSFHPPPTAPNPSTGNSLMWFGSRLPPISSSLEALPENTPSDFKKTRGKTAYTRTSSAIGEEKAVTRGLDGLSRPNTTHTFRVADNFVPKRAASGTPSNFAFEAHGNSILNPGLKSSSPAGLGSASVGGVGSVPYPMHSTNSPDTSPAGLVRITGRSINLGVNNLLQSSSPDDQPGPPHASWGPPSQNINAPPSRRKKQVFT